MLGGTVQITCAKCCQNFMWDLENGPAHKSHCPYCDGDEKIKVPEPKKKRKKAKKKMLTKAERHPENEDCDSPEYPQEWFLDFHCRSLNEYHKSPHLRVRDKGAAYRAIEKAGIPKVRRTKRKVKILIVSYRKMLVDCQSLYGGSSKGLVDVLVRMGWLHDDSPDWCDPKIEQEKVLQADIDAGAQRGTKVILQTIPKPRKKKAQGARK